MKKGEKIEFEYEINDPTFKMLHECAVISSECKFDVTPEERNAPDFLWRKAPTIGDASETAII
jgi:sodium/potassium-transporting ATPase subunit alpha